MGVIAGAAVLVGGIISTALSRQLADEFKAWTPWIIERIIRRAVARLPRDQQERFGEEFLVVVLPLMGLITFLVLLLHGKGSVISGAERVGLRGRRFTIFRFCTVSRRAGPTKIGSFQEILVTPASAC